MPDARDTGPNTQMFRAFVERGEVERQHEDVRRSRTRVVAIVAAVVLGAVLGLLGGWLIFS